VSVYLFRRDLAGAWTARQRITPPATNWIDGRNFGNSLALADGYLAVGDPMEGPKTPDPNAGRGAVAMYSGIYETPLAVARGRSLATCRRMLGVIRPCLNLAIGALACSLLVRYWGQPVKARAPS
jgi:hypothetical protein